MTLWPLGNNAGKLEPVQKTGSSLVASAREGKSSNILCSQQSLQIIELTIAAAIYEQHEFSC